MLSTIARDIAPSIGWRVKGGMVGRPAREVTDIRDPA
jgi:hypothetical protein